MNGSYKERILRLEERIVRLEAEVTALRQEIRESGADHLHAGLKNAESAAPPCDECEWHEHRPDPWDVPVVGSQERCVDGWLAHLRNALFDKDSRILDQLEVKIRGVFGSASK